MGEDEATDQQQPIWTMVGPQVALGPLRRDLLPRYWRWVNDLSTTRGLGLEPRGLTLEEETGWYERQTTTETVRPFTIYECASGRPIGTTGLHDLNYRHRHATFGIMIGEADCRGRGLGTETTRLMLDYAFNGLGLHNVMLSVYEFNLAGLSAYRRAGFREFGRRRQAIFMGGHHWDEIMMDCLASEFVSPLLQRLLRPDD